MPSSITLTFSHPINVSCQVGDTAYYVTPASSGEFSINTEDIVEIGEIRQIAKYAAYDDTGLTGVAGTYSAIVCHNEDTIPGDIALGSPAKFILFSKDNKANMASVLGYFANVKFVNNSLVKAELFSVGLETIESSK